MTDEEISKLLADQSPEFKILGEEHSVLKSKLNAFSDKLHLTPEEELEKKQIQKLKLMKKDRMALLINEYRKLHEARA